MSRFTSKLGFKKKGKPKKEKPKKDKSKKDKGSKGKSKKGKKLKDSSVREQTPKGASTSDSQTPCPRALTGVPKDPCFLYKMVIREEWPEAAKEQKKKAKQEDPQVFEQNIQRLERAVLAKQDELDLELSKDVHYAKAWVDHLRAQRDALQKEVLALIIKRSSAAPFKIEHPSTFVREFTILKSLPDNYKTTLATAEENLEHLRDKLRDLIADWNTVHGEHEQKKKTLMDLHKKLEKLAAERDKRLAAREAARRDCDQMRQALKDYNAKDEHSKSRWKTFKRSMRWIVGWDPQSQYDESKAKLGEAENKLKQAKAEYDAERQNGYTKAKTEEKAKREEVYVLTNKIRAKIKDIEEQEASVMEIRNTLVRGGKPIQMIGGAAGPWWAQWEIDEDRAGRIKKAWSKFVKWMGPDDKTPTVTVTVDADRKPQAPKDDYQEYCAAPIRNSFGKHPYLRVRESRNEFRRADIRKAQERKPLKFKVWQDCALAEYEDACHAGFRIFRIVFRIVRLVASFSPKRRTYDVEAFACGFYTVSGQNGQGGAPVDAQFTDDHAAILYKDIEVFPADSWEITIKAPPAFGGSYEREQKFQHADEPQAEGSNLEYQSSGSKDEETTSTTISTQTMWGTQSTTTTTSDIVGRGGGADKNIHEQTTVTRDGSNVRTFTHGSGTFGGEDYSGSYLEHATLDATGNKDSTDRSVYERGHLQSRTDPDVKDPTEADIPHSFDGAPDDKLSRAPSVPGSFFPMCPIDISFKRNGAEDEVTANLKKCIGLIVFTVRKIADCVGRIGNIVPSWGWKFGFQLDFCAGSLSYFHQFKEHTDWRVYMYRRGTINIDLVTAKIYIFVGAWVEFIVGEIKAGIEIYIKGKVGVKGQIENTHPDANNSVNIGFGPTGGIGCGGEIVLIIGSADWCKAAGTVYTGITIEGMWWLKHTEGMHWDYNIGFEGIRLGIVGHLVLVGTVEHEWHPVKARTIKKGRFPAEFDEDSLEAQSAEMDRHCLEDAKAARKRKKKLKKKMKKSRK